MNERDGIIGEDERARLVRYAASLGFDPDAADDAVQQAVVRLLLSGRRVLDPFPYLARSVFNLAVSEARARRSRRTFRQADAPGFVEGLADWMPEPPGSDPHDLAEARMVADAVRSLPAIHARTLMMLADDMGAGEIAAAEGLTLGSARVRIHRARAALKAIL